MNTTQNPPLQAHGPAGKRRSTSFYVAWILAFLIFLAGGVILLLLGLLAVSAVGFAGEGFSFEERVVERTIGGSEEASRKIAVLPIRGIIGMETPLIEEGGVRAERIRHYLARAERDPKVVGVLVLIDSPGGTVTDSDQIHAELTRFKERSGKPVLAYLHSVAASGGYYIAVAADRVLAHPTTLTGSIGVLLGAWNYSRALEKLGLERVKILSEHTPMKDILAGDREMREEERVHLQSMIEEMYERFVAVVDEGRPGLDLDEVRKAADGRIYSAGQALELGLVDEVGDLETSLAWFREKTGIQELRLSRYGPPPGLLDFLTSRGPSESERALEALTRLLGGAGPFGMADPSPRMMYLWTGNL